MKKILALLLFVTAALFIPCSEALANPLDLEGTTWRAVGAVVVGVAQLPDPDDYEEIADSIFGPDYRIPAGVVGTSYLRITSVAVYLDPPDVKVEVTFSADAVTIDHGAGGQVAILPEITVEMDYDNKYLKYWVLGEPGKSMQFALEPDLGFDAELGFVMFSPVSIGGTDYIVGVGYKRVVDTPGGGRCGGGGGGCNAGFGVFGALALVAALWLAQKRK